jgi:hypothetical protein
MTNDASSRAGSVEPNAGRLRSRWITVHTNEVYFRDTAHGFLAWAVSTLITVTLLTSAVTGVISGGVKAGAAIAGGAVATAATVSFPLIENQES